MPVLILASLLSFAAAPRPQYAGLSAPVASVADSGTVRQTRKVGAFDSIDASGAYELVVDASAPSTSVVVEAAPALAEKITTEVRGRTLVIKEEQGTFNIVTTRVVVTVGVSSLSSLSQSGAIEAAVSGIHAPSFGISLSGADKAKLSGTCGAFSADLSGAASLNAVALKAKSAKVSVAGSGSAKVWASDSLAAEVSGVASISYYGKPAHVTQSVSGVGSISAAP